MFKNKLIVLRGNSGCGKSTIANKLHAEFPNEKIALISQDYFRRNILREKGSEQKHHIQLIENTVTFCMDNGFNVILEGIFHMKMYGEFLDRLNKKYSNNYFFYFDVSLEETLKRSEGKPNYREFGPEKIKDWFIKNDFTGFENEYVIGENLNESQVLEFIKIKTIL